MRLQYLHNKKIFSHYGVIFKCDNGKIKICHIPYCGMSPKTAELLSKWLKKRSGDINYERKKLHV